MMLHEAIIECLDSKCNLELRRDSWTHGDSMIVKDQASYMGGVLFWKHSGNRVELFNIDDLLDDDWSVE